jgi:hypothetical protein
VPPDGNQIVLSALASDAPEQVEVVRVLGTGTPAPWSRDETGLKVVLPDGSAGERGYALAIDLEQP